MFRHDLLTFGNVPPPDRMLVRNYTSRTLLFQSDALHATTATLAGYFQAKAVSDLAIVAYLLTCTSNIVSCGYRYFI